MLIARVSPLEQDEGSHTAMHAYFHKMEIVVFPFGGCGVTEGERIERPSHMVSSVQLPAQHSRCVEQALRRSYAVLAFASEEAQPRSGECRELLVSKDVNAGSRSRRGEDAIQMQVAVYFRTGEVRRSKAGMRRLSGTLQG